MHFSLKPQRALPVLLAAVITSLVAPLMLPLAARADDDGSAAPAGVGVARLSVVDGNVAIQRGDSNTTVDAVVNAPVLGADYVTTGAQSRAELQFDGTAVVRLGDNVQMRVSRVDQGDRQIQLAAGTIDYRLLRGADGQNAIDTPSISVVPQTTGSYRITVDQEGTTFVTVRSGHAQISVAQGSQQLDPGTTLVARGAASDPHVSNGVEIAADSFDDFNAQRDSLQMNALAQSYVSSDIDGAGDLNAYGRWADDGSYGHVWMPSNVGADWAPYRDGNWTWEDNYGWTWVGAEPWGWAPYHYGRWYYSTAYSRWAWYPPAYGVAAPAWSPALVGFIGFSIGAVNVGIGFGGFGNVGWVPLAPYEAFHPWWGRGATNVTTYNNVTINRNVYVNNGTIENGNVSHVYRNAQYNGVTSVTAADFRAGRFGGAVAVSTRQLATYRPVAVHGALPVVPSASNLRFTQSQGERAPIAVHTSEFTGRTFAGRPAVTERTPFVQQQAAVARVAHLALPESARTTTNDSSRAPSYAAPQTTITSRAPSTATNDSWSRFNSNRGERATLPAQERPQTQTQTSAYARPATSTYARPATPAYDRAATPSYARPESPAYNRGESSAYNRPESPAYNRPESPAYNRPDPSTFARPATPSYNRPDTSSYARPAAPSYVRPQTPTYSAPRPAAPAYARQTYSRPAAPSSPSRGNAAPQAHERGGQRDR